jgi:tyrosinase
VNCILKAPSKLPVGMYPGAKSRYDDFTVVHMNMTPSVHSTANFMHWHRYYIWAYETALRTECAYTGYQPYWDWAKYADIVNSPIFNGDEWSMGGNGESVPHTGTQFGTENLPAGPGGGCVTKGAFVK